MAATRIKSGTLVASTVATVTFPTWYAAVEVINRSPDTDIFATLGTTAVTVDGDDMEVVPAGRSVVIANPQPEPEPGAGVAGGDTDIQLISSGTPKYTVKGL